MASAGVLVIYTGGTIGSRPKDPDPDSPQVVVGWEELRAATPELDRIGFPVECVSTDEPLDSCNVGPTEWRFMAETIGRRYDEFEGFVILHGTDTMVYTASALSFMLRNLGKPVVLTGAQRSAMVDVRNDATQNFITSLLIANPSASGVPLIPEVCICFGGKILRGNRSIKRDTSGYSAYESPNLEALGEVGDSIMVNRRVIRPQPEPGLAFNVRPRLDTNVLPIFVYPGIQNTDLVRRQLEMPGVRAAVVQSYGSGNIPTIPPSFLDVFREARDKGIVLVNVSQCKRGPVEMGIYETSAELVEAGFVSGWDITVEAAQCKLMTLLGDPDADPAEVEIQFQEAVAGEQSVTQYLTRFGEDSGGQVGGGSSRRRLRGVPLQGHWESRLVQRVVLRLLGARLERIGGDEAVEVSVHLNADPDEPLSPGTPTYAGSFRKWPHSSDKEEGGLSVFDITDAFRRTVSPNERFSATFVIEDEKVRFSWQRAELAVFVREG